MRGNNRRLEEKHAGFLRRRGHPLQRNIYPASSLSLKSRFELGEWLIYTNIWLRAVKLFCQRNSPVLSNRETKIRFGVAEKRNAPPKVEVSIIWGVANSRSDSLQARGILQVKFIPWVQGVSERAKSSDLVF